LSAAPGRPDEELGRHYLEDVLLQLRKYRDMAEKAIVQVPEARLFEPLDAGSNSLAVVMKHLAGNMRSRWTDFLTSDGEKPDRERDREFRIEAGDTRESLFERWEAGWERALASIGSLGPEDLLRTVRIRGESHTVVQAIDRQLTHYAYHVGQIVMLARHAAGDAWSWLSIPPGRSREFEVSREGNRYPVEEGGPSEG
jgi:hypothetical protein